MGAGVQTTALLLMDQDYDYVVFADTGSEKAETYEYVEKYLKPFCREREIEWVTVKNSKYDSLEAMCAERKMPPDVRHRVCTKEFKVRPIQIFMKRNGHTPYTLVMGISYDEAHRANFTKRVSYEEREFPLVEQKITRERCYEIIKQHGWPIPEKSGCDFCPFMRKMDFRKLAAEHPERYRYLMGLEETFVNGMVFSLSKKPMKSLAMLDSNLDDWMEPDTCESGHCFV